MSKNFNLIFGGIIAYILLILYGGTLFYMIREVIECGRDSACNVKVFNNGIINVATTVGGLVSALVVSKLAITTPGDSPAKMIMSVKNNTKQARTVESLVWIYLIVWLVTGLMSFIVGNMVYPDINDTLSDIGKTWLGLAVASGYAYFGVNPSG